jgi:hypothetical protein
MNRVKATIILVLTLSGAVVSTTALAHGGHVRFGIVVGAPGYWYGPPPYYYYPPYYYPPYPPVVVPSSPPVYVERNDLSSTPDRAGAYWYYCADTKSYYPYVKECPSPWQRVEPRAPNS